MEKLTITDLLNSLANPNVETDLPNTKETWERINNGDNFEELGLVKSELDKFITEWTKDNDYKDI